MTDQDALNHRPYDRLSDEEKLLLEAFLQQYRQELGNARTPEQHRDHIAGEYLTNRNDRTNLMVQFIAAMSGRNLNAPTQIPPRRVLDSGPQREMAALAAVQLMQQHHMRAAQPLISPIAASPTASDGLRVNFNCDAYEAGQILLPIARRMDRAQGGNRFMASATAILQRNHRLHRDIGIEAAFAQEGLPSPSPSRRIDTQPAALVSSLLQRHEGVFFGEHHGDHSTRQVLIDNLQEFRRQGVRTLFLEATPETVADYRAGRVTQDMVHAQDYIRLVQAAEAAGIQVVGYDTNQHRQVGTIDGRPVHEYEVFPTAQYWERVRRDQHGASVIDRTMRERNGRYLVLGGSSHSGRFDAADPEKDGDDWGYNGYAYQGLDSRLNIPSIDFMAVPGRHSVYSGDGRASTYVVNTSTSASRSTPGLPAPPSVPAPPSPEEAPSSAVPPVVRPNAVNEARHEGAFAPQICLADMPDDDICPPTNLPSLSARNRSRKDQEPSLS